MLIDNGLKIFIQQGNFAMLKSEQTKRSLIAQGWILMFLVFICIFITEFVNNAIDGNLAAYQTPEGQRMVSMMVALMLMHAVIPVFVSVFSAGWFRWTIAGLTGLLTLLMVAHEIIDLAHDYRPFGILHMLDFAHHGLGIWVTVMAVYWARETLQVQGSSSTPLPS